VLQVVADENFKEQIVNGLRRRLRDLDITTAQDAGLRGSPDPEVLEWAAGESRVVLTHDTRTMKGFAYARVARAGGDSGSRSSAPRGREAVEARDGVTYNRGEAVRLGRPE
jgi:hypothetical protein